MTKQSVKIPEPLVTGGAVVFTVQNQNIALLACMSVAEMLMAGISVIYW